MTKRKILVAVIFVLMVVVFVAFTYLNTYLAGLLKTTVERETLAQTGLKLDLGSVEVSALQGDVTVLGPRVVDPSRAEVLALAQSLTIDANPWSLLGEVATINKIELSKLESTVDLNRAIANLPKSGAPSAPSAQARGLRIDTIDVDAEEIILKHQLAEDRVVQWKIRPAVVNAGDVRVPFAPGARIRSTLSAQLVEPSTGSVEAQFVFSRPQEDWHVSGSEDVRIAQIAALNPYFPPTFPVAASSGSVTVRNQMVLRGTILESTTAIALYQPRFEPRERSIRALFAGGMSKFAVQAIRDAQGDIVLDPIYVSGDLNDPNVDLAGQFLADLRRQILSRIFRGATTIPTDMARQLETTLRSLPPTMLLEGADQVVGKALQTGAGLVKEGKKIDETAKKAVEGLGSGLKSLFKRKK